MAAGNEKRYVGAAPRGRPRFLAPSRFPYSIPPQPQRDGPVFDIWPQASIIKFVASIPGGGVLSGLLCRNQKRIF
jgi:hypothetical protein